MHPLSALFLLLLVATFGSALGALARGLWRALRGTRRGAALAWTATALLWLTLGWYGLSQWGMREVPHNLPFNLADRVLSHRRFFTEWGSGWGKMSGSEREEFPRTLVDPEGCQRFLSQGEVGSYLRELTGPFVDFLLRRHGAQRFVCLRRFLCRAD